MIKHLVIDVDGVLTDGGFAYNTQGIKSHKFFGPDDADALKLISQQVTIDFVSADSRGFSITKSRISDMKFDAYNISSHERLSWIKRRYNLSEVCYIADGFWDAAIFAECAYSIATSSSAVSAQLSAKFVTSSSGGSRGLSEGILYLMYKFSLIFSINIAFNAI